MTLEQFKVKVIEELDKTDYNNTIELIRTSRSETLEEYDIIRNDLIEAAYKFSHFMNAARVAYNINLGLKQAYDDYLQVLQALANKSTKH